MKILLLSYFYPPYLAAGASRAGQLVSQWRAAGANVTVLAATPGDIPRFGDLAGDVNWTKPIEVNALPRLVVGRSVLESGFQRALPGGLHPLGRAYRQLINFPDGQVGWLPTAVRAARRLIREITPDVIISTSPPATAHLAALRLKKGGVATPWVAEFRDPWTRSPNFHRWGPLKVVERRMELAVVRSADAVVAVTPGLAAQYGELRRDVYLMTNGFTAEDYPDAPGEVEPQLLLHVGTVYPTYDFETLFRALRSAKRAPRVLFVGRNLGPLRTALAAAGDLPIEIAPPLPRMEVLRLMTRAWANLAFVFRAPSGGAQEEYMQQKFYEYIGARRPIVAIGPAAGDGARLLASSGLARFATDAEELCMLFDDRSWTDAIARDENAIDRYSYRSIGRAYLDLLAEVSARGRAGR